MAACSHGIRIENGKRIGTENCVLCRACEDACMSGALKFAGEEYTVEQLVKIADRDMDYYSSSGGGVTVSGGEPLLQYEFVGELFAELKRTGISTALDTAGNVEFERFAHVLPNTDLVLLDLKIMDEELHRQYTGVSNKQILKNAKALLESGKRIHIRVPVMAGVNDSIENALKLKAFIQEYDYHNCVEEIRFLAYHNMGLTKAASVNIKMQEFLAPAEEKMKEIRVLFGDKAR